MYVNVFICIHKYMRKPLSGGKKGFLRPFLSLIGGMVSHFVFGNRSEIEEKAGLESERIVIKAILAISAVRNTCYHLTIFIYHYWVHWTTPWLSWSSERHT